MLDLNLVASKDLYQAFHSLFNSIHRENSLNLICSIFKIYFFENVKTYTEVE